MSGKGILVAKIIGELEIPIQMMRKITEQALYRHDKTFANNRSDSDKFSTSHEMAGKNTRALSLWDLNMNAGHASVISQVQKEELFISEISTWLRSTVIVYFHLILIECLIGGQWKILLKHWQYNLNSWCPVVEQIPANR